jgi:N-methylhydantoinase B
MPDVEIQELFDPKLFVYRRLNTSSGGAGSTRGGLGVEDGVVIRGTERIAGVGLSSVERVPPRGFGGGRPGAASSYFILPGTTALADFEAGRYPSVDEAVGERIQPPSKTAELVLEEGDVIILRGGGGGGLGDPLFRDPAEVMDDVRAGYITAAVAKSLYGVVGSKDGADAAATDAARAAIRKERLGADPPQSPRRPDEVGIAVVDSGDGPHCAACDTAVDADVRRVERKLVEAFQADGMDARARPAGLPRVLIEETFCKGCGSALAIGISVEETGDAAAAEKHDLESVA